MQGKALFCVHFNSTAPSTNVRTRLSPPHILKRMFIKLTSKVVIVERSAVLSLTFGQMDIYTWQHSLSRPLKKQSMGSKPSSRATAGLTWESTNTPLSTKGRNDWKTWTSYRHWSKSHTYSIIHQRDGWQAYSKLDNSILRCVFLWLLRELNSNIFAVSSDTNLKISLRFSVNRNVFSISCIMDI